MSCEDCSTAKFDWKLANDVSRLSLACNAENCASCDTDWVSSMGLSGSWFDSCVVSSCRKALGPSWLVMDASLEVVDDVPEAGVVLVVPLLIRLSIGRLEETPEVVAIEFAPRRGS